MKLNIIQDNGSSKPPSLREQNRIRKEAEFERAWFKNPEQFNPSLDPWEREKLRRIEALIPPCQTAVDIGSGYGMLARRLAGKGIKVTAVDIADGALKKVQGVENITPHKDCFPYTKLDDNAFDIVILTDLIASLPAEERRLGISEAVRLLKPGGYALISTPVDIQSEDAWARFIQLVETEFVIREILFSHNYLWVKWPFLRYEILRDPLEKISKFLWQSDAIDHVIVLATVKPLYIPPEEPPVERKTKKSVWE